MKILQCITSVDRAGGGPVESMIQVSKILAELGHSTEVACLDAPQSPVLDDFPLSVHALGPGKTTYQYSSKFVPWLRENARSYDCVLVRGLWRFTTIGTRRALRDSGVPYFVFAHGMLDPWFKKKYPLKHLKKLILWHAGEYAALRDAAAVLFTTETERALALESFRPNRWNERVVRYGTAAAPETIAELKDAFFADYPELKNKHILLFLGRLHPKKGCDLLIESFSKHAAANSDLALVIAGPDQIGWQSSLEKSATALGCAGQITWTGMITGDKKWAAYAAADAFVLPSHQENFGISVVEALSCNTPVLISDQVNICREVAHAEAGIIAADTQDGTTSLLDQWFALSKSQRAHLAQHARALFDEKFEITAAARSLIETLQQPATT